MKPPPVNIDRIGILLRRVLQVCPSPLSPTRDWGAGTSRTSGGATTVTETAGLGAGFFGAKGGRRANRPFTGRCPSRFLGSLDMGLEYAGDAGIRQLVGAGNNEKAGLFDRPSLYGWRSRRHNYVDTACPPGLEAQAAQAVRSLRFLGRESNWAHRMMIAAIGIVALTLAVAFYLLLQRHQSARASLRDARRRVGPEAAVGRTTPRQPQNRDLVSKPERPVRVPNGMLPALTAPAIDSPECAVSIADSNLTGSTQQLADITDRRGEATLPPKRPTVEATVEVQKTLPPLSNETSTEWPECVAPVPDAMTQTEAESPNGSPPHVGLTSNLDLACSADPESPNLGSTEPDTAVLEPAVRFEEQAEAQDLADKPVDAAELETVEVPLDHGSPTHGTLIELTPVVPDEFSANFSPSTDHAVPGLETYASESVGAQDDESLDTERPDTVVESLGASVPREPKARKYKPAPRGAPGTSRRRTGEGAPRERALPIEVRARLERGGFCRITLLPRRGESLPEAAQVKGVGSPGELCAMQEEWYQDVEADNAAVILRNGVVWVSDIPSIGTIRWSLSGREIFVLAPRDDLSGFVSAPRLLLGEDHVVLCTTDKLAEVEEALQKAGVEGVVRLQWDRGASEGWLALSSVTPQHPVAPCGNGDILDVLRPAPDAQISLSGGIRITCSAWLVGFPPVIRILGDSTAAGTVYIDGQPSIPGEYGAYVAPGWDAPGDHGVSCLCGKKNYEIAAGLEAWQPWDAYTWSSGDASSQVGMRPAICGALVQPPQKRRDAARQFSAPASNALLIGPSPGQIHLCEMRSDLRASTCVDYPQFEPMWAIPIDPMHCDKNSSRVLRVGCVMPDRADANGRSRKQQKMLRAWAQAILDATRKGLRVEPSDEETQALWSAYRKAARTIWRMLR